MNYVIWGRRQRTIDTTENERKKIEARSSRIFFFQVSHTSVFARAHLKIVVLGKVKLENHENVYISHDYVPNILSTVWIDCNGVDQKYQMTIHYWYAKTFSVIVWLFFALNQIRYEGFQQSIKIIFVTFEWPSKICLNLDGFRFLVWR